MVIYRELHIKDLPKIMISTMEMSAMVGIIIAAANVLTWLIAITRTSETIAVFLSGLINSQFSYLLVVNLVLVFVGALMDTVASIIIFAPVLIPLGISLGLDPLHIGVLFCVNLVIGYVTPPFGYNLFTAVSITKLKFEEVVKGTLPFLAIELVCIFILAFCPGLITWLPKKLGM
jgi:C4-dicarboxylate transporter DctM subunit